MKRILTITVLTAAMLTSCASKKKYVALEEDYNNTRSKLLRTQMEKEQLEERLSVIEERLAEYSAGINLLREENNLGLKMNDLIESKTSPIEEYKLLSNFPTESNVERTYEMSSLYQKTAQEFYQNGIMDSAQVYYAKSAFIRDPSMILNILPLIEVVDSDNQTFENFTSNKDNTDNFVSSTKWFLKHLTGEEEIGENVNSFPEAVLAIENIAFRGEKVKWEIVSEVGKDVNVSIRRFGKDYLPWTPIFPDTTLTVSRARYFLKYKINGKEKIVSYRCGGNCKYIIK